MAKFECVEPFGSEHVLTVSRIDEINVRAVVDGIAVVVDVKSGTDGLLKGSLIPHEHCIRGARIQINEVMRSV